MINTKGKWVDVKGLAHDFEPKWIDLVTHKDVMWKN